MNINMAKFRNLDLYGRNYIEGKLGKPKDSNDANIEHPKASIDNLGYTASISKESKIMLGQLTERRNIRYEVLSDKSQVTDSNGNTIIHATQYFESDKAWLFENAYDSDHDKPMTLNFDKLKSAYNEIRNNLETQYNGKELEDYISQLDKDYEDTLAYIADSTKRAISYAGVKGGKKGEEKAIENIFGMKMNTMKKKLSSMELDLVLNENNHFIDYVDTIIKILAKNAKKTEM